MEFWENLPLLERPNFEAYIYATKRINSKKYTRNCLIKKRLNVIEVIEL